jgi:Glycosyltransferase family 87
MLDLRGISISLPAQLGRRRLRLLEWLLDPRLAIGGLLVCLLAVVLLGAEATSFLTPSARGAPSYPSWLAGPLHGLLPAKLPSRVTLQYEVTLLVGLMLVAYVLTLRRIDRVPSAWVITAVLLAHMLLLLAPPLFSTDVFGYINYARLGALHGLNPYSAVPADGPHNDPSYVLTNWHHLSSPYGPLFTLLTYPLAFLGVPAAFWIVKVAVVAADLGVVALVWKCARLLGRPPAAAVTFVALNPLVLLWMVGADHNDSLMMLMVMVSVYFSTRAGRADERRRTHWLAAASGLAIVAAAAIKPSAAVLLPIVLVAGKWPWKLAGMALAAVAIGGASLAAFGLHVPSLSAQSDLIVPQGLPNLLGLALGLGGETSGLHAVLTALMLAAIGAAVLYAARRPGRWLTAGAAAVLALVLALSWTQAWYVFWVLPLAALARERRLRLVALAVSALLFVEFMPAQSTITARLNIRPGATPLGVHHQKATDRAFY